MAKRRTVFVCQCCGYRSQGWLGRCPACEGWDTFAQELLAPPGAGRRERGGGSVGAPQPLAAIEAALEGRLAARIGELDRVLGGGLVRGSAVLIGGDPGIGKSTLVLQALAAFARDGEVLYVSGEESPQQIKLRADRLGIRTPSLMVLASTALEEVLDTVERVRPRVVAVDSIQTLSSADFASAAGSVGQVRECAARLVAQAKTTGAALFLVGHVTKDGALAGPRTLEHMVDTVLYFEAERAQPYRILRAVKNRFGSTNEIGMFEMTEAGLRAVANPSALFLAERPAHAPGSAVVATMEGTRPILVEIQALVSSSVLATPRRTTLGLDPNRVAVLNAILEKKMGLPLAGHDIFVSVAGGVRVDEPAADLGVIAAVASSFLDRPLDPRTLVVGETGLAGEVRAVGHAEARVREAAALGFRRCILPDACARQAWPTPGIELVGVRSLAEAWRHLF